MKNIKLDLLIPIYNEGFQIIKLLQKLNLIIKSNIRVLLCYDSNNDNIFEYKKYLKKFKFEIKLIKNKNKGPCEAIKEGLRNVTSNCVIVYPADDFLNVKLIDKMHQKFLKNKSDIIVASRFIKGGTMKGCPLLKSILVRLASSTLYFFSSIPVRDASNGFRLFSKNLLDKTKVESNLGFAYSLELLVKCDRMKLKIDEIPAKWEERTEGKSNFKIFKWLRDYLKWYFYGLETYWLKKKYPINLG
jgi:dolichol-phosphate mannosyltransferase